MCHTGQNGVRATEGHARRRGTALGRWAGRRALCREQIGRVRLLAGVGPVIVGDAFLVVTVGHHVELFVTIVLIDRRLVGLQVAAIDGVGQGFDGADLECVRQDVGGQIPFVGWGGIVGIRLSVPGAIAVPVVINPLVAILVLDHLSGAVDTLGPAKVPPRTLIGHDRHVDAARIVGLGSRASQLDLIAVGIVRAVGVGAL